MSKEAVFTIKIREFIQRQHEAREYNTFLHNKVERARNSMHAEVVRSNDEVETAFTVRRTQVAN